MTFDFFTDDDSRLFCERIVAAIELLYDIDQVTGTELLNRQWRGHDWRDPSHGGQSRYYYLLYHETERDWANRIGNPHPNSDGHALDEWLTRDSEAARRVSEFQKAGIHQWLYS